MYPEQTRGLVGVLGTREEFRSGVSSRSLSASSSFQVWPAHFTLQHHKMASRSEMFARKPEEKKDEVKPAEVEEEVVRFSAEEEAVCKLCPNQKQAHYNNLLIIIYLVPSQ